MDRRRLLALGLGMFPAPRVAKAQQAKVSRIGILTTGDPRTAPPANWEAFVYRRHRPRK
ncbi:MAG: hypothetical protein ACREA0_17665 [bacterium]